MARPRIVVVGSVNLDLVARCEHLPRPGETVTGATFSLAVTAGGSVKTIKTTPLLTVDQGI